MKLRIASKEAFKEFKIGPQRHIVWEEELLFPLWEERTGMVEDGPTPVMRFEHSQIRQYLDAIHQKVEGRNPDTDREEQALYPAIDNVTSVEERATIFSNMNSIPEDRYNACCGQH